MLDFPQFARFAVLFCLFFRPGSSVVVPSHSPRESLSHDMQRNFLSPTLQLTMLPQRLYRLKPMSVSGFSPRRVIPQMKTATGENKKKTLPATALNAIKPVTNYLFASISSDACCFVRPAGTSTFNAFK